MLSAGYARTYEQSGAEYGRWGKEEFLQYEEAARSVVVYFPHSCSFPDCGTQIFKLRRTFFAELQKRGCGLPKSPLNRLRNIRSDIEKEMSQSRTPGLLRLTKKVTPPLAARRVRVGRNSFSSGNNLDMRPIRDFPLISFDSFYV